MKSSRFLCLVGSLVLSFSPTVVAEDSSEDSDIYVDNYRFVLSYTSEESRQTDVEFVVSGGVFEVSAFDPELEFKGTVLAAQSGSLVLQYDLQLQRRVVTGNFEQEGMNPFQTVQVIQGGLRSNIRLRLGKPVEILRMGRESATLTVSKVD